MGGERSRDGGRRGPKSLINPRPRRDKAQLILAILGALQDGKIGRFSVGDLLNSPSEFCSGSRSCHLLTRLSSLLFKWAICSRAEKIGAAGMPNYGHPRVSFGPVLGKVDAKGSKEVAVRKR